MIETAIGFAALVWVLLSWVNLLPKKYTHNIQRYMCHKCITLWITLICTCNPLLAATAAFIAYMMDRYINNDNNQILL